MHEHTLASILAALTLTFVGGCGPNTKADARPVESTSGADEARGDAPEPAGREGGQEAAADDDMDGGDGAPNLMPSTPEDGEYTRAHSVLVEPDNDALGEAVDCLVVSVLGSGEAEFRLELYFDMEHSCELSGVARPTLDGRLTYEGSEATQDAGCELSFVTKGGSITLEEKGNGCSPSWCGARGVLDGATFSQDTRRADSNTCGM